MAKFTYERTSQLEESNMIQQIETCLNCGSQFDINQCESNSIHADSGIDAITEQEVVLHECPHCQYQACYD